MNILFKAKEQFAEADVLIATHPLKQKVWPQLRQAIEQTEKLLTVINSKNDRSVKIPIRSIISFESEDR